MWIDTHCHFDFADFDIDRQQIVNQLNAIGVDHMVIPSIHGRYFDRVQKIAHQTGYSYALGIHPLYIEDANPQQFDLLREAVSQAMSDPLFIGIGEIGLDFFQPDVNVELQTLVFTKQLQIASEFALPVICHNRRSTDQLYALIKRFKVTSGIVHAFNGSWQQAEKLHALGMKLGFGGIMTFPRAKQIRRLAVELPLNAIVLETDAPDLPPIWAADKQNSAQSDRPRNTPEYLPAIGQLLATLREESLFTIASQTTQNTYQALPRLKPVSK